MEKTCTHRRRSWRRLSFSVMLSTALLGITTQAHAICGLDAAVFVQIRNVQDLDAARS